MRRGVRLATLAAALLLAAAGCTSSTTQTANNSPLPSESASPSPSPSPSPSGSPSSAPSPSPSSGGALSIIGLPFHNGEVGIKYLAISLTATGGTQPYQWSISGGTFPPGLTLSQDGAITGTNTKSGQFSFTVKVTDSTGASTTSPGGFGVFPALSATQPCANQCTIGAGCSKCGGFGAVSGGLGPYTYKLVGGAVPDGMALNGLSLKGAFPQSPLGAYNVSVAVTDQFTATVIVNANWFIYNPATLSGGTDCTDPNFSGSCTATGWSYNGGNPGSDPVVTIVGINCPIDQFCTPTVPPGWTAVAKGGTITISASLGTSCSGQTSYQAILTLALVDKGPCPTTSQSNRLDVRVQMEVGC